MNSRPVIAALLLGALMPALLAVAHPAQAQSLPAAESASCFNVVAAQPPLQPAILVDRCSGRTWLLIRRGRHGRFAWNPIARHDVQAERPAPKPAAAAATGSAKCFSFQGRTFCE